MIAWESNYSLSVWVLEGSQQSEAPASQSPLHWHYVNFSKRYFLNDSLVNLWNRFSVVLTSLNDWTTESIKRFSQLLIPFSIGYFLTQLFQTAICWRDKCWIDIIEYFRGWGGISQDLHSRECYWCWDRKYRVNISVNGLCNSQTTEWQAAINATFLQEWITMGKCFSDIFPFEQYHWIHTS